MKILFILLFLCSTANADALFTTSGSPHNLETASTDYTAVWGPGNDAVGGFGEGPWGTGSSSHEYITPTSGELRSFRMVLDGSPGSGNSYAFTVQKNSVDTSLTCTISDTDTECTDMDPANAVSFVATDELELKSVPTSSPTARAAKWSFILDSDNGGEMIIMGRSFEPIDATRYCPLSTTNNLAAATPGCQTDSASLVPFPVAGTFSDLYIELNGAPGSGNSMIFTLRKGLADTALTCTISGSSDTTCSDTSNTVSVSPTNLVNLEVDITGTPSKVPQYAMVFTPDIRGEYMAGQFSSGKLMGNSGTKYVDFHTSQEDWNSTESGRQQGSQKGVLLGFIARLNASPGAGTSYTFTVRKNGADTELSCAIADSATQCTDSGYVRVENDDTLNYKVVPANTPTNRNSRIGTAGYLARRSMRAQ